MEVKETFIIDRDKYHIMIMLEKIQEDNRGEIWRFTIKDRVFWLSRTMSGYGRGGDIHIGKQYNLILGGAMKVLRMYPGGEKVDVFKQDNFIICESGIPHLFIALEDNTIMLEWHEFPLPPYKDKEFYKPYRDIIE